MTWHLAPIRGGQADWTSAAPILGGPVPATLKPRTLAVLHHVQAHTAEHGYPPTYRQIAAAVGLASVQPVHYHLGLLERAGLAVRGGKQRPLRLIAGGRP